MPIYDQVNEQIKESMRARDTARTTALRNIRAAFIEALKLDNSTSLSDEQCVPLLRRLAKQRLESIEAYTAGKREDLVSAERAELAVIEGFLPQGPNEATVREWVSEAIAATGASSRKEIGKVMGAVMKAHPGQADGKIVKAIAEQILPA